MNNNIFLYDVHAHTNTEPLLSKVDEIVKECQSKKIIFNCIGTNVEDSIIAIQQARKYKGTIFATVGLHPSEYNDLNDVTRLEQLYLDNKDVVVAFGEVGLDYHEPNADRVKQKMFFRKLIEMFNKYDLPICVHCRDAEEDCLQVLRHVKDPTKVWIHCFSGSKEIVNKYMLNGFMISIPGIITFKNAHEIHESISSIPIIKLMAETDSPWLAPEPFRGKTNKPIYVEQVADCIAKHFNMTTEKAAFHLTWNSLHFFKNKF